MRKWTALLLGIMLLCGLLLCGTALAEDLSLTNVYATVTVSSTDYIVLTKNNLSQHPEWLESHGMTSEMMLEDWEARGVYAQAWSRGDDVCLEISAIQDEPAQQYYSINNQSSEIRKTYRMNHTGGVYYGDQGYTYTEAVWKTGKAYGRWLLLTYKYSSAESSHRGYQYRTIRNGYTITLDYQIYGRDYTKADLKAIQAVMSTFKFTQVLSKPSNYVCKVAFTSEPPTETTTGKISIAGTCDAGLHLTAVAMRMSSSDKVLAEDTAGKTGKFSIDFKLPSEGTWLVTLTVDKDGTVTEEKVFDVTTYSSSLLKVTWTNPIPTEITGDTMTISGTTLKSTTVQCIVGDNYTKQITTSGKGTFSFKVPTSEAGEYDIVLVFQKKGYDTRRFTGVATRTISEDELRDKAREQAVKPSYTTLVEKIKGYTGKTLTYSMYVTSVSKSGDEWVMLMAMSSTKNGYKNLVAVTSETEPNVTVGSQYRIYGTCVGTYMVQEEGSGEKYYPCLELLWIE